MDLPDDILVLIFSRLDGVVLLSLQMSCHRFKNIIELNALLQYMIELHTSGLVDGPRSATMSTGERTDRLLQHRRAWDSFVPRGLCNVPKVAGYDIRVLSGSSYVQRAQLVNSDNPHALVIHSLPANTADTLHQWRLNKFKYPITDLAIDPSQDLLAIMHLPIPLVDPEWNVVQFHILTISTGEKHPLASQETLRNTLVPELTDVARFRHWRHTLQVHGHLLGVLHAFEVDTYALDTLTVWDWTTGTRLMNLRGIGLSSFAFLTTDRLLIGMMQCPLYNPHEGDEQSTKLVVCDIRQTFSIQQTQANAFLNVCELQLPPLRFTSHISRLRIQSGACPNWWNDGSPLDSRLSTPTFYPARDNQLFAIILSIYTRNSIDIQTFGIFVPFSTLQALIAKTVNRTPGIVRVVPLSWSDMKFSNPLLSRAVSVPWREWGIDGSRLFQLTSKPYNEGDVISVISGLRYVVPLSTPSDKLEILDFNGRALRRFRSRAEEMQEDESNEEVVTAVEEDGGPSQTVRVVRTETTVVTSPTSVCMDTASPFKEDFETRLQYRRVFVYFDKPIRNAMVSEEHLILETMDGRNELVALSL